MKATLTQLATLCQTIYTDSTDWDQYWTSDDVVVGLKGDVLVLRGSLTAEDWARDAAGFPIWHTGLGFVHAGFIAGMDDVLSEVSKAVVNPIITGHSLGGARARLLAGLFAYNDFECQGVVTFGSPKPAFLNLARLLEKSGMEHTSYRNRNDIVPTLPLTVPPCFDFVHTEPWTAVDAAPADTNMEPLRDHSIALYLKAMSALDAAPSQIK